MTITREVDLNDPLFDDVKTPLFIDAVSHPPHWAHDILQPWNEQYVSQAQDFISAHLYTAQGSVNVFQIVGTAHPDYKHISWLDLLVWKGKRMNINLPLQEKYPEYYDNTDVMQPMMYFNTLDGLHFYIGEDGNHRSCIARFYFHASGKTQLHGVTVNHYQIDDEFYQYYLALGDEILRLSLPVTLTSSRNAVSRKDTAGWKIDYFETHLSWQEFDPRKNKTITTQLTKIQAREKLLQLQRVKHAVNRPSFFTWLKGVLGER